LRSTAVTDIRDPYTALYQRRVADLSMAIGRTLHLDTERLDGLFLGALVHDVGKVLIPIDVLSCQGRSNFPHFGQSKFPQMHR
jgi:HD-GYP domain-containing protein (c-di-GMP phosphodiesterase class II)